MGQKMGERISPPNTWKHTTKISYHFVDVNEMVLSSERKLIALVFVRHLQL